jgi:hypothetical protein
VISNSTLSLIRRKDSKTQTIDLEMHIDAVHQKPKAFECDPCGKS